MGDLSNDVNERTLDAAFNKYPSFCKCKVVRDRLSEKVRYHLPEIHLLSPLSILSVNLLNREQTGDGELALI